MQHRSAEPNNGQPNRGPGASLVERLGIRAEVQPPASPHRFPDAAHFRIEIPSIEGPDALAAVVESADRAGIVVNRVSQGSGAMLLSLAELAEMGAIGAERGLEVSLFVGPRDEWDVGATSRAADGPAFSGRIRGARQLRYAVEDVHRACEQGIRSFLVADPGLLEVLAGAQHRGELPAETVWKVSAYLAPTNPVSFAQLERLGASTINVPSDMTLGQLSELRSLSELPIDLYVESPDGTGGVVRGHELGDIVPVAAPIYAKFGLRNARPLYPAGIHLRADVVAIAREKVHRAAVGLEWLARTHPGLVQSAPGAKGLGIPDPGAGWSGAVEGATGGARG
ncbi:MAG TPA: hypothetical protein VMD59_23895 [Acidimicrobiales bacterium]|nr:hypothetical protein [Acidimicrobiales bacterium]